MPKLSVEIAAPAKVNLTLHVTGQRTDGYHLLDSLVVFASVGDTLTLQSGDKMSLVAKGPEGAAVPADLDNLVLKVASLFEDVRGASFLLNKHLPVSSGIGGGSADAAAAYRGLMCLHNGFAPGEGIPPETFDPERSPIGRALAQLGADIPVCLRSRPTRMRGIGDDLTPLQGLPALSAVLVNPRVAVPTPNVFKALTTKTNPAMPDEIPRFSDVSQLVAWLALQRNDLEAPARSLVPEIGQVLGTLHATPECLLARMSGSGATCFGLYPSNEVAAAAASEIGDAQPNWWVRPAVLGSMADWAMPRIS